MQDYLRIGRASELSGKDRIIYRLLEILPGLLSWGTIISVIVLSWKKPVWVAIFIILFDVYWLVKTIYLSFHLRMNWKRMKQNLKTDWYERLENMKWSHVMQMVVLPFYKEEYDVIKQTLEDLCKTKWPKDKMIIILAREERAGNESENVSQKIYKEYEHKFGHFLTTKHPKDIEGELAGKGSNIAWAAEKARTEILNKNNIKIRKCFGFCF